MKNKAKFDKKLCAKCIYHQDRSRLGFPLYKKTKGGKMDVHYIHCNYCCITGETCIKRSGEDIRGDGPECNLFVEGASIQSEPEKLLLTHSGRMNIYR